MSSDILDDFAKHLGWRPSDECPEKRRKALKAAGYSQVEIDIIEKKLRDEEREAHLMRVLGPCTFTGKAS